MFRFWFLITVDRFRLFEKQKFFLFSKEDYVMFAVFNILFFQGIPLPWQTKHIVFRDRPFPIIVVNKATRRVPLYISLIGINVIIIKIII